ncbi:hypothetical protein KW850_30470 [Bacillus sp. sid0103]|uniref:hypothetical protein n=1 Tax=Bacillus sp. sid0103 TaxID=2856337 RepID=UPI001C437B33|nr:hypothetical protein [Bacillus sp. sid0103]MBV7509486.1 hypothetical protein [Bacillus sp. sid0103]
MPFKEIEKQRAYQREYYRRKRNDTKGLENKSSNLTDVEEMDINEIQTAKGMLSVLAEQMAIVRTVNCDPITRARAIAQLVGVGHKVIETAELEERLKRLEDVLEGKECEVQTPGKNRTKNSGTTVRKGS